MATMSFSVPPDVKKSFDLTFAGQDKNAVLTELMRKAMAEQRHHQGRDRAIADLLSLRKKARRVSEKELQAALVANRGEFTQNFMSQSRNQPPVQKQSRGSCRELRKKQ